MPNKCPLCGGGKLKLKEVVDAGQLNRAYQRQLGIRNALKSERFSYYQCPDCGLGVFDPLEAGSEELYEQLQNHDWYYLGDKYEYEIARSYLPQGGSVLEVGAGRAAFALVAGIGCYTGLEFNDRAIEAAGRAGVRLVKQTVEQHAESGCAYDAVVAFQVLEHVADPSSFIQGCVQCLKCGGYLMVAVPAMDGFVGMAINNILNMPPHHVTHWPETALRYLGESSGLDIVAIKYEPVAKYHVPWARRTLLESRIRRWFGFPYRLLVCSWMSKLISRLSAILVWGLPVRINNTKGHTVVAVYRKT